MNDSTDDGDAAFQPFYLAPFVVPVTAQPFASRREALDAAHNLDRTAPLSPRFDEFVDRSWLPHLNVSATTRHTYTSLLRRHLLPAFADVRLSDLSAAQIRSWLGSLASSGVGGSTRDACRRLLSSILNHAVSEGLLAANPCAHIRSERPLPRPAAAPPLTVDQFDRLYAQVTPGPWQLLVDVAIETGASWGEITELRSRDVDPSSARLAIGRRVIETPRRDTADGSRHVVEHYRDNNPKRRFVDISARLRDQLGTHVAAHRIDGRELLFAAEMRQRSTPATTGQHEALMTHLPRRWFLERILRPAASAAGLQVEVTQGLLQRTNATWLLQGGASVVHVQQRLGLASIASVQHLVAGAPSPGRPSPIEAFDAIRYGQNLLPSDPSTELRHEPNAD